MLPVAETKEHAQANSSNPLQVAVFGFDPKATKLLEVAFKNYGENCATIVEEKFAEAAIFDFDLFESRRALIRFKTNFPNIPTVIVSSQSITLKDGYLVLKPLRVGKFISIFREIQAARSGYAGVTNPEASTPSQQAAVPSNSKAAPSASSVTTPENTRVSENPGSETAPIYDPEDYLQGIIHSAVKDSNKHGHVSEIIVKTNDHWLSIKVLPGLGKISSELKKDQLKYLCSSPLYCLETKVVKHKGDAAKKLEQLHVYDKGLIPLESFLWSVAKWTCDSRLPSGIDLNASYALRRWPNFTRLRMIPNALSMTAILVDKPMNLKLFHKVVNLPTEEVFTFLACVDAIGLLAKAGAGDAHAGMKAGSEKMNPTRGIFEKLVSKLRIR